MATDATGAVTSPDNIPTYNTAADAPSGKGLNAIVAAIQAALSALRPSALIGYPADATKALFGDGTWKSTSPQKITTTTMAAGPPGSPATGDIWIATSVDANGTAWKFQYDNAQATYKWVFIGGNEAYIRPAIPTYTNGVGAFVYTNSGLIVARAGDYKVKVIGLVQNNGASTPAAVSLRAAISSVGIQTIPAFALIENGGNQATLIADDMALALPAASNIQVAVAGTGQPWVIGNALVTILPTRVI